MTQSKDVFYGMLISPYIFLGLVLVFLNLPLILIITLLEDFSNLLRKKVWFYDRGIFFWVRLFGG